MRVRPLRAAACFLVVLTPVAVLRGQESFVVASVKPNVSGVPFGQSSDRPDGVTLVNELLRDIILFAYELYDFQLIGGPDWVSRNRFDVLARASEPLSLLQKRVRLQRLLADRFALRVRTETREHTTYELTMVNGRAGNGLKVRDCGTPGPLACGRGIASPDGGVMRLGGIPIARLATFLGGVLGGPVIDQTGLSGVFDVDLQWRPDIGLSPDLTPEAKAKIETRPALPVALREQLGLIVQPRRGPVSFVVIEHVQQPTAD